jgi:phage/plasmid-associated DNA primase
MRDLSEVRAAYERGEGSLRELAERFSVSLSTIKKRAAKETWNRSESGDGENCMETVGRNQSGNGADTGTSETPPAQNNGTIPSGPIVPHLVGLLGEDVVLLRCNEKEKGPRWRKWQESGPELMRHEGYLRALNKAKNIAVLLGSVSGGLCTIDIDDDEAIEPFLELNPELAKTLRSRGKRGCNLWVRIDGDFPGSAAIKRKDGSDWGEWRSERSCTMIHGIHPEGVHYERSPEVPPISIAFDEIVWPEDLVLPWMEASNEEADKAVVERYGPPVFFARNADGGLYVDQINQPYWAGLYAAEHTMLHEPEERTFYLYDHDTGLYCVTSPDFIKQEISYRMLEVSRSKNILSGLVKMRSDGKLNAVVSQLRGVTELREAFADRPKVVHLANCMLRFDEGGQFEPVGFSPEFRSRNRSPIEFDPNAECPRFLNELILPAVHEDDVSLLQRMAGQCLLGDNLLQRFVILDGTPGGGKSQYANVVQALVGQKNVTQLRTDHLHERFELFRYLRRTLLVGVDVDADFLQSKGAPVIKGLVGSDWYDAEQKGGTGSFPFQGRFNILMTSNCRLKVKLQGDVGAWHRRLLIVRYESPPPKKKIENFGEKLVAEEGPGILNWALEGLGMLMIDLRDTGDIRLTARQKEKVDSLLAESDSLRYFLQEKVERVEGDDLTVHEIVQEYAHYCPDKGWEPLPETRIGRQLPDLMLELFQAVKSNSCQRDGKSARGFRGVGFINREVLP